MEDSNIAELQSWFIIRILKSKLTDLGVRNRVTGDRSWQIWSSIFHHELLNSEHQARCLRLACVPSRFTSPTWYTLNTSHLFRKEPESQIERKRALGGTVSANPTWQNRSPAVNAAHPFWRQLGDHLSLLDTSSLHGCQHNPPQSPTGFSHCFSQCKYKVSFRKGMANLIFF